MNWFSMGTDYHMNALGRIYEQKETRDKSSQKSATSISWTQWVAEYIFNRKQVTCCLDHTFHSLAGKTEESKQKSFN